MSQKVFLGFNIENYICKRFDEIVTFNFGLHAMFLVKYKNFWKCLTPYDFCKEIVIKDWGCESNSEFEDIVNNYLYNIPEEDHIKIVYPRDGYYPREMYKSDNPSTLIKNEK